ncbi:hypothetical protein EON65_50300 [archaeon]|nr:MAG: hypothetical protein EON65_50300 [archaeon]
MAEEDGGVGEKIGMTHGLAHLSALSQNVRAPSILPLSLLTSIPLLLPSHILHVSPSCMRSANIFNSVARSDLCNSLTVALNLTIEERKRWKREVRMCRGVLSREGTGVIQGM